MYGRRHWLHYLKAKIVRGDWMTKDRATISLDQFFNYIGDQIAPKRKKKKKSRRHKHNVQWQIWSWSLATGLWTMSIIQPPTRGIQRAQTQQITAAAGKYSLKTTSPVANCMPWQLRRHQPRLLSRLEQLDDSKVYLFFVLTVKIQCGARGGFLKPQSASKQKEMQPNILFLLVFW